jgi:glycosyltransferase involved in cell wall biosynthesis
MKILVLHSELGVLRGGGENFTKNLFTAFAERGHHVAAAFVANHRGQYPIPLPSTIEPIPSKGYWSRNFGQATLSAIGRSVPNDSPLRKKWNYVQEAISWRTIRWHNRRFQRRIERVFTNRWSEFDAVYVHGDPFLASNVARHRPTVLRLPGPVSADCEPELRAVHAVCANGDALLSIRSFLGNHATELRVGLDKKIFKPGPTSMRSKLQWAMADRVVGYVGRLTHLKGVDLLAAAFREVSKTVPNARLLIVGQGEAEKGVRSVLAKELARGLVHIERDVDHEQLPQWYRAMDLFVMPSRYENFSNAVLEAISCGVPVLASDVGGNGLLADGAGCLFQADSVSSLSACLRTAIHEAAAIKAGAAIRSRNIAELYSWTGSAERLERIISSCLATER